MLLMIGTPPKERAIIKEEIASLSANVKTRNVPVGKDQKYNVSSYVDAKHSALKSKVTLITTFVR